MNNKIVICVGKAITHRGIASLWIRHWTGTNESAESKNKAAERFSV